MTTPDPLDLRSLVAASISEPARVARVLIDRAFPREVLWLGLILVVILSVIFGELVTLLAGATPSFQPMVLVLLVSSVLVLTVFVLHFAGRAMGGAGEFGDTLTVIVWTQFLGTLASAVVLVISLLSVELASMANLVAFGLIFWVSLHALNEANQFASLWRAFGLVVFASFGTAFGIIVIMTIIFMLVPGAVPVELMEQLQNA